MSLTNAAYTLSSPVTTLVITDEGDAAGLVTPFDLL